MIFDKLIIITFTLGNYQGVKKNDQTVLVTTNRTRNSKFKYYTITKSV